jgi:Spy/CpxP family protein refolding chaperone
MIGGTLKGKMLIFSVFFLGIASGAILTNLWETRLSPSVVSGDPKSADRAKADRDVNKFNEYLGLTPDQKTQMSQILKDSRPEYKKIFDQMDALRKQNRNQIRAILTDEQKVKYDKFYEGRGNRPRTPGLSHSN